VCRAWWGRTLAGIAVATLPFAAAGCTSVVPGVGTAAAPTVSAGPTVSAEAPPPPTRTSAPVPPPGSLPGPRAGLDADPIADECLLNASEFGELVGGPVRQPEQGTIERGDGSRSSSCVATTGRDPVAMINVYTVRTGTPADYVRAGGSAGRRELPGVGDAAVVIDTHTGPTLQLASPRYLVTILVSDRPPSDDAWRTAAIAALSRLPE
jgi:hypothetical protein